MADHDSNLIRVLECARMKGGCEVQQGKDEVKAGFSKIHGTSFDGRWTQS